MREDKAEQTSRRVGDDGLRGLAVLGDEKDRIPEWQGQGTFTAMGREVARVENEDANPRRGQWSTRTRERMEVKRCGPTRTAQGDKRKQQPKGKFRVRTGAGTKGREMGSPVQTLPYIRM